MPTVPPAWREPWVEKNTGDADGAVHRHQADCHGPSPGPFDGIGSPVSDVNAELSTVVEPEAPVIVEAPDHESLPLTSPLQRNVSTDIREPGADGEAFEVNDRAGGDIHVACVP